MPAWPGGPCPECGDDMPAKLVRCATCRALLNPELTPGRIEPPEFIMLPEVATVIDASPAGFFVQCPHCQDELRIAAKYVGQHVACKSCQGPFQFLLESPSIRITACYTKCPHCDRELRVAPKYRGMNVACKFCDGGIHLT